MKKLFNYLIDIHSGIRSRKISKYLLKIIRPDDSVLDVGAGSMEVAEILAKRGSLVEGIDVIDFNKTSLPFKLFDGQNLPYRNKSMDVVLLVFVLHHLDKGKQKHLLNECFRVARRVVVVAEDVYNNRLELELVKLFDSTNKLIIKDMFLPFSFRSEGGWLNIFSRLGIKNIVTNVIRPVFARPTRHRLFELYLDNEI